VKNTNKMKGILIATALVIVYFLGLSYEEPKTDYVFKDRTDWKAWKNKHDQKPWEI
jgi:hypothetical protein